MALIELEGLRHRYRVGGGLVWALDGVSLNVEKGEFVAVMGPSGSGKSTFMNILGCLDRPTEGIYRLDGVNVGTLHDDELAGLRNCSIGFVFQSFNLLPRTSASENVELPLIYRKMRAAERRRRARAFLEKLGLADRARHTPAELSGGEQQRVAIARALVTDPLVLLADEPTGSLDSETGRETMAIFRRLNEEGLTIVVVTHQEDVAANADRIVTFRDGRVIAENDAMQYAGHAGAKHGLPLIASNVR